MTRADLFREYARVIEMCEGTTVDPVECVSFRGTDIRVNKQYYTFSARPELYTFALCIVENKPVFAGDVLYHKSTGDRVKVQIRWTEHELYVIPADCDDDMIFNHIHPNNSFSWSPPAPVKEKIVVTFDHHGFVFDAEVGQSTVLVSNANNRAFTITRER